jgi:hypothetical protein
VTFYREYISLSVVVILATGLFIVFSLLLILFAALGIAFIGWILSLVFPMSAFEGAIVTIGTGLGVGYVLYRLSADMALFPRQGSVEVEEPQVDAE